MRGLYGPFTIPANDQLHNIPVFGVPTPCPNPPDTSCRITDFAANLVDASTGNPVNLQNDVMLHHFVLFNPERADATCSGGLQGGLGERFFAAGNEGTHLHLPRPYGYLNSRNTTNGGWTLVYHLVNKGPVPKQVNIEIIFRYRSVAETLPANPIWLDIDSCEDSEYSIPTGYSDFHDTDNLPSGGPYASDWTVPYDANVIGIAGHLHDIDITWCYNGRDDDGDGRVNDGCPAIGAAETQCTDSLDNDSDGKVNDGCPVDTAPETQCTNATDDDEDGRVNDGCAALGAPETQCTDSLDNDSDGRVNDGCVGFGRTEAPCTPHCGSEGGGIAVSAEVRGGSATTYYGPSPPNNTPPTDLTGATLCRSEGYYGTPFGATAWQGHLDTMSQCGLFWDLPAGAQPESYPARGDYEGDGFRLSKGDVIRLHSEYQNNTAAQQDDVMGIMMAWLAPTTYARPVGASPLRVSLVPAFRSCATGNVNSTHGAPLNFDSCHPPTSVSSTVQTGNGSVGYAQILVCNVGAAPAACKEPAPGFTTTMQPDVRLWGTGRNIQCRLTGTPSGCTAGSDYNPNGAPGPYTTICVSAGACGTARPQPFCAPGSGSSSACIAGTDITATAGLGQPSGSTVNPTAQCGSDPTCLAFVSKFAGHGLRVTDSYNCNPSLPAGDPDACPASSSASRPATLVDLQFPVPVDCLPNPEGAVTAGSNCGANTTANALVPGTVIAGKAAVVEIGEIQMLDSGPDGTRGNTDDQRFAVQGIFIP